jgi:hypothetical protein
VPHAELVSVVMQLFPLQQPWPHELESHLHAPLTHSWPVAQIAHATPPVPHVPFPEAWQRPLLSQQPLGHEVASQTHLPAPLHRCPWAQAPHAAPPVPHAAWVSFA